MNTDSERPMASINWSCPPGPAPDPEEAPLKDEASEGPELTPGLASE